MAERPASPPARPPHPPRKGTRFLVRAASCAVLSILIAFLVGSGLYIFQQSRDRGLPLVSGSGMPDVGGVLSRQSSSAQGFAHQDGPCTSCHKSINEHGKLYLAINGRDVTDNPTLSVRAGDAFELAVHFVGMAGDLQKYPGVGVEIVCPRSSSWSVGPGSGKPVDGWSPNGSGRDFWSPAWNRGGAGNGTSGGRWKPVPSEPGSYYIDYSASSWSVQGVDSAARDDGGPGDADGRANSMGTDALVSVPLDQQPGKYEIIVAATGTDSRGNPAQVSGRISVQVEPAPAHAGSSNKPIYATRHGIGAACGSCHSALHKAPANHQGIGNGQCTLCHTTTISGPAPAGGPAIPHAVDGRSDCLSCHRQGGLRPTPSDHTGRTNASCTMCHQAPTKAQAQQNAAPQIPHSLDGRTDCATCHSSPLIPAVPADHANRPNEMCVLCHPQADTRPSPGAPDVPHSIQNRSDCLTCHGKGFLGPVAVSHAGMAGGNETCQNCHQPQPQVNIPGRAPDTPHLVEGRSNCLACHGPGGLRPEPADHKGRPSAACIGCHPSSIDESGSAPKIPHVIAGRKDCLTCHSSYLVPPVPSDHSGRTNDSCSSCHRQAAAAS